MKLTATHRSKEGVEQVVLTPICKLCHKPATTIIPAKGPKGSDIDACDMCYDGWLLSKY